MQDLHMLTVFVYKLNKRLHLQYSFITPNSDWQRTFKRLYNSNGLVEFRYQCAWNNLLSFHSNFNINWPTESLYGYKTGRFDWRHRINDEDAHFCIMSWYTSRCYYQCRRDGYSYKYIEATEHNFFIYLFLYKLISSAYIKGADSNISNSPWMNTVSVCRNLSFSKIQFNKCWFLLSSQFQRMIPAILKVCSLKSNP